MCFWSSVKILDCLSCVSVILFYYLCVCVYNHSVVVDVVCVRLWYLGGCDSWNRTLETLNIIIDGQAGCVGCDSVFG